MKKFHVIISHSLGELDVILPIFLEFHNPKTTKIKIIITTQKIYNQYLNSKIYNDIAKKLNIKIIYSQLYNKFDYPLIDRKNTLVLFLNKIFNKFISFYLSFTFIVRNFDIFFSKIIFNDASSQIIKNLIKIVLFDILKKRNYVYHHGHAFTQEGEIKSKNIINKKAIVLLFDENCKKHWTSIYNYSKFHLLGFPKFFKNWIEFIKNYNDYDIKDEKYVLIYSRQSHHKYYMDIEKYDYLIKSSYKSIRENLPDYKIYIKTHPRENINYLKELIKENDMKNIEITFLHSSILAKNAFLIISYWTSSILESLSLKIPSVEFYIEANKFRIVESKGSVYKNIGIHSVSTKKELDVFINDCINHKYVYPNFLNKYFNMKNNNFLETN